MKGISIFMLFSMALAFVQITVPIPVPRTVTSPRETYGGPIAISLENDREGHYYYYVAPIRYVTTNTSMYQQGDSVYYFYYVTAKTGIMIAAYWDPEDYQVRKSYYVDYGSLHIQEFRTEWHITGTKSRPWGLGTRDIDFSGAYIRYINYTVPPAEEGHPTIIITTNPFLFGFKEAIQTENGTLNLNESYLSITTAYISDKPTINETVPSLKVDTPKKDSFYKVVSNTKGKEVLKANAGLQHIDIVEKMFVRDKGYVFPSKGSQLTLVAKKSTNTRIGEVVTSATMSTTFKIEPYVRVDGILVEYKYVKGVVKIEWYKPNIFADWTYQTFYDPPEHTDYLSFPEGIVIGGYSVLLPVEIQFLAIARYKINIISQPLPPPPPEPPIVMPPNYTINETIQGGAGGTSYTYTVTQDLLSTILTYITIIAIVFIVLWFVKGVLSARAKVVEKIIS